MKSIGSGASFASLDDILSSRRSLCFEPKGAGQKKGKEAQLPEIEPVRSVYEILNQPPKQMEKSPV